MSRGTARSVLAALIGVALISTTTISSPPAVRAAEPTQMGWAAIYDRQYQAEPPFQTLTGAIDHGLDVTSWDPGPDNAWIRFEPQTVAFGHENGTLEPGTYENASRNAYADERPRLDIPASMQYFSCPAPSHGRFVILEGPTVVEGVVTSMAADFELICNGHSEVRGALRFNATTPFRFLLGPDLDFGTIPTNGSTTRTVEIGIPEYYPTGVEIGAPVIAGDDADAFEITSTTCVAGTLEGAETCSVTVRFDPTADGAAHGVLAIPTDLPLGDHRIDLDGTASGADTEIVLPGGTYVSRSPFYPYPDGYQDTTTIRGHIGEPATAEVEIRNSSGSVIRRIAVGDVENSWQTTWDGRKTSGTIVGAGTFKIVVRYTDQGGNKATSSTTVTTSSKRLYTYSKTISQYPDQFAAKGKAGTGSISTKSSYTRGRRIGSGANGYAALGYEFRIPSATVYKKFTVKVVGRSPNGRRGIIGIQNFGKSSAWIVDAFDELRLIGPSYGSWSTSTTAVKYFRSGRKVRGMVYVEPTATGANQRFDIQRVKLTVSYALLK